MADPSSNAWQIILPVFTGLVGILLGVIGTHLNERWKLASEKRKDLRREYANWLTDKELLTTAMSDVLPLPKTYQEGEIDVLHQKLEELSLRVENLLKASNLILLMETDSLRSQVVKSVTSSLLKIRILLRTFPGIVLKYDVMKERLGDIDRNTVDMRSENKGMLSFLDDVTAEYPHHTGLIELKADIEKQKGFLEGHHSAISSQQRSIQKALSNTSSITSDFNRDINSVLEIIRAADDLISESLLKERG